jgi:4-hydroxyacetophenone monooxygenase
MASQNLLRLAGTAQVTAPGVLPITEDDETIRNFVADAELPALLAALAHVTGDMSLVSAELRPPLPPMAGSILPQGGMDEAQQRLAWLRAANAIIRFRDAGCPPPAMPTEDELCRIIRFLTKDADDEYVPLLKHELALPDDTGTPGWAKDAIAPERQFRVAVIGAGLSGLAIAHRLRQAGVDFVVLEKSDGLGGAWWNNTYPGCRLDTPNFAYSYSFAQKTDWPDQFSRQPDIRDYINTVADELDLRRHVLLNHEVIAAHFHDESATWRLTVRTPGGENPITAEAVVSAVGQLSSPNIPELPGRKDFAGPSFHSAQWDHDFQLDGKRVAVIGSGASAFQIVPSIADQVAELNLFMRNPPWMLPTPTYHAPLREGFRWLLNHIPYYGRWYRFFQFWISVEGRLPVVQGDPRWRSDRSVGAANEQLRQELLAHLRRQYAGRPDLIAKMEPDYPPGAKRLLRDNGVWARALKSAHSNVITSPIARIAESGIVTADGQLHEVDAIVYATGFRSWEYLSSLDVTGRNGASLHKQWGGDPKSYLGITVPNFPNLFMILGPNTALAVNGSNIFTAEAATEYVLECIRMLLIGEYKTMECLAGPCDAFNKDVDEANSRMAWGAPQVNSWYKSTKGRVSQIWPFSLLDYWNASRKPDPAAFRWA